MYIYVYIICLHIALEVCLSCIYLCNTFSLNKCDSSLTPSAAEMLALICTWNLLSIEAKDLDIPSLAPKICSKASQLVFQRYLYSSNATQAFCLESFVPEPYGMSGEQKAPNFQVALHHLRFSA